MRAAAIIERNGAILLMRRLRDGRRYYVFPGGTVEDGETPAEACAREVREETGLIPRAMEWIATQEEQGRPTHYFRIREFEGMAKLGGPELERDSQSKHYSLEWIDADRFPPPNLYPANACTLVEIRNEPDREL